MAIASVKQVSVTLTYGCLPKYAQAEKDSAQVVRARARCLYFGFWGE
jgi:hypothetical protein